MPVALLALILLILASSNPVFHLPYFPSQYFNIVVLGGASFFVAYLAWRGFSLSGQAQLLLFGSGALSLGMAMALGSAMFLLFGQGNVGTTLYGTEELLSGILFLTGAGVEVSGGALLKTQMHRKRLAFGIYATVLLMPILVWALSATGVTPVFYVPGQGVTLIRTVVLDTALSLFAISGFALLWVNRKVRGSFLYWYGMGLLLLALGLFAWQFVRVNDDSFTWLGRVTQYLGGVYFVIAAVSAVQETRTRHAPVAEVVAEFFRRTRETYQRVAAQTDGAAVSSGRGVAVSRRRWYGFKWLGLIPLLLLSILVFLSNAVDTGIVYYPPLLFSALNIIFSVIISLVVAYIAARGFRETGQSQLVWFGGGALVFGVSGLLSAFTQTILNTSVTVHNTGALLAAVLYVVSALSGLRGGSLTPRRQAQTRVLVVIYGSGAALTLLIMLLSLSAMMPTFFIPGMGGTPVRQVVVYGATALFGVSGLLLLILHFRARAGFLFWYSMGLLLIGLGIFTVSLVNIPGDIFAWLGRGSQYLGGIYLIVAVLSIARAARSRHVPVAEVVAKFASQAKVNYELLVNAASDAIIAVDGPGRILMWNPAAEKMFGYRRSEAIGSPFFDLLINPEDASSCRRGTEAAIPNGDNRASATVELKARRRNGKEFPVELTLVSRRLANRWLPTTTTLVIRDITERKKAEAELAYRATFPELNPNPIVELDATGSVKYLNPSAKNRFPDLTTQGNRHPFLTGWEELVNAVRDEQTPLLTRDIQIGDIWYEQTVFRVPSSRNFRIYGRDITERKHMEHLKDEFIGMVSHELRTPLTILMGAVKVAMSRGLAAEQVQELLKDADMGAERLAHLLDNLVELSRYQADRLRLARTRLDIGALVRETVRKREAWASHRSTLDIEPALPPVSGDELRLGLVLSNLLDNAVKYSPAGTEIRISVNKASAHLLIAVSDQGKGIPTYDQSRLFRSLRAPGGNIHDQTGNGARLAALQTPGRSPRRQNRGGIRAGQRLHFQLHPAIVSQNILKYSARISSPLGGED